MYEDIKGKKLLILGATVSECQIVRTAHDLGVYTITTDNHSDWDDAPAKKNSDEAWDISWSDISSLAKMARIAKVDGVIAGYSEFRTKCAIQLSKELGTSFYITDEEQLDITRDKLLFKKACRENGVPVAKDYYITPECNQSDIDHIVFPVIIKPADNAGSRGIRFCKDAAELKPCVDYALSFSESHRIVVEEVLKGHEFIAYYTIANGEAVFASMFDKYARIEREGFNALMDAYVYPSNRIKYYIDNHDINVRNMFKKMGLKNGVASVQGFIQPDGCIVFFELGFRLGGTNSFIYTDYFNHVNHLKMLISYSLTGNMHPEELTKEDPLFRGEYGCTFTLLSKDGTIGFMSGKEEVDEIQNVLFSCFYHKVGTQIKNDGSQFSKTFRAYIVGNDLEEIRKTIIKIQKLICVKNTRGENMLYDPFDVNLIDYNY